MRASTLFAITLSLLLGLGAVAGARYAGLFDKKEAPPAAEKPIVIKVLVANSTLYKDIALTPDMVTVRDKQLGGEEERRYKEDPGKFMAKFMPGSPKAVSLRIPKKTILAEQVLLADMFEDPELPPGPTDPRRVEVGYRAVNVAITKGNSVGGTLRLGDYVDVWLTSKATLGSGKEARESIASACIARGCKIVMKRNLIWPVLQSDADDKPVNFTLQANPYRAAVIEYADNRGELSLRPAPAPAAKAVGSYSDITSKEYADEDDRVRLVNQGEFTVGDADLMRIFNLKPPAPVPPPPAPVTTRRVFGTDMYAPALYDPNGGGPLVPLNSAAAPQPRTAGPQSYTFGQPKGATNAAAECESCGK
jgi:Flp pilus assembly protein CpaB